MSSQVTPAPKAPKAPATNSGGKSNEVSCMSAGKISLRNWQGVEFIYGCQVATKRLDYTLCMPMGAY